MHQQATQQTRDTTKEFKIGEKGVHACWHPFTRFGFFDNSRTRKSNNQKFDDVLHFTAEMDHHPERLFFASNADVSVKTLHITAFIGKPACNKTHVDGPKSNPPPVPARHRTSSSSSRESDPVQVWTHARSCGDGQTPRPKHQNMKVQFFVVRADFDTHSTRNTAMCP